MQNLNTPADSAPTQWPALDCATRTHAGKTYPALDNCVPSRFVSIEEARSRGWPMFWTGAACRYGHQAARWTSNTDRCSGCVREKAGKPQIYPKSRAQDFYAERKEKPAAAGQPIIVQAPAREFDAADKRYLTALAETRDPVRAAETAGTSVAQIVSRRAVNKQFSSAVAEVEQGLLIAPAPLPASPAYQWTAAKRQQFLKTWIDSGDISAARDAIGCPASDYFAELEANEDFRAAVANAEPLATKSLEDRAHTLALAGNDKLLNKLLTAKMPQQYSERMQIDMNVRESRVPDDVLTRNLLRDATKFLSKLGFAFIRVGAGFAVNGTVVRAGDVIDGRPMLEAGTSDTDASGAIAYLPGAQGSGIAGAAGTDAAPTLAAESDAPADATRSAAATDYDDLL